MFLVMFDTIIIKITMQPTLSSSEICPVIRANKRCEMGYNTLENIYAVSLFSLASHSSEDGNKVDKRGFIKRQNFTFYYTQVLW